MHVNRDIAGCEWVLSAEDMGAQSRDFLEPGRMAETVFTAAIPVAEFQPCPNV